MIGIPSISLSEENKRKVRGMVNNRVVYGHFFMWVTTIVLTSIMIHQQRWNLGTWSRCDLGSTYRGLAIAALVLTLLVWPLIVPCAVVAVVIFILSQYVEGYKCM